MTELITLGAKVGAGTGEKKIAPASSNPQELAHWIIQNRNGDRVQELQVSVGFDTTRLPSQEHRGKFIALFLFIASTYLKDFQALVPNPTRDSNAAYGLLIRGDVVEAKLPGQAKGRRLDYIFNLSREMTEENLTHLLHQIQLLNLGLLLATAEESHQLFFPDGTAPWMDPRTRAIAEGYRRFEREFIKLLRDYDNLRDPERIYSIPDEEKDNQQRKEAFRHYHLEESLFPASRWLVALYHKTDTSWQALLPLLKAIEGMMLHQGGGARKVKDKEEVVSKGQEFIERARQLGYDAATGNDEKGVLGIEKLLVASSLPGSPKKIQRDPFIDPQNEEATRYYLQKTTDAIAEGRLSLAELPDAKTFFQALSYYQITRRRSELRNQKQAVTASEAKDPVPRFFARHEAWQAQNDEVMQGIPQANRRETVPRKEPVEVPETVPAKPAPKPQPAPAPKREPAPSPRPSPRPREPEKVPAGLRGRETRQTEMRRDIYPITNRFQEKYAVVVDMNVFDALSEEQQTEFKKLIHARPGVKFVFNVSGERRLDSSLQELMDFGSRYKNLEIRVDPVSFDFQGHKIVSVSKEGIPALFAGIVERKLGRSKNVYAVRYGERNTEPGLLTAALLLLESRPEAFLSQGRYFSSIPPALASDIEIFLNTYVYIRRSA